MNLAKKYDDDLDNENLQFESMTIKKREERHDYATECMIQLRMERNSVMKQSDQNAINDLKEKMKEFRMRYLYSF